MPDLIAAAVGDQGAGQTARALVPDAMRAGSPETGGCPTSCTGARHGHPDPRTWSRHLSCHRAQQLDLAGRRASARGSEAEAAPDRGRRYGGIARPGHVAAGARPSGARCGGRGGQLLRGRTGRLLAAPAAHGPRHRQPRAGADQHPGQPPRAAGQDRPARRPRPAARADGLSRRRPAGLQHGAGADARGGGRQAPAPRARASGAGEGSPREPDRGVVGDPGHPAETLAAFMGARPRRAPYR